MKKNYWNAIIHESLVAELQYDISQHQFQSTVQNSMSELQPPPAPPSAILRYQQHKHTFKSEVNSSVEK